MRSQFVILALALGLALWMLSSFLTTDTPNLPTMASRLVAGLMATTPLFLVAIAAAMGVILGDSSSPGGQRTGPLLVGLIASTLWAYGIALSMGRRGRNFDHRQIRGERVPRGDSGD